MAGKTVDLGIAARFGLLPRVGWTTRRKPPLAILPTVVATRSRVNNCFTKDCSLIKPVVPSTVPLPDNWCIVQLLPVEAPGNEYQTPGCIPYGGAISCEADSLRGLKNRFRAGVSRHGQLR